MCSWRELHITPQEHTPCWQAQQRNDGSVDIGKNTPYGSGQSPFLLNPISSRETSIHFTTSPIITHPHLLKAQD